MADEAYHIGEASSQKSYLDIEKVIAVATKSKVQAIHPGYGFLSENARFAASCAEAGIRFVGPPARAIEQMGDKTTARALMREANVPMAPGSTDAIGEVDAAAALAEDIGYPVLIKAAAGGGGKGMRLVERPDAFPAAFAAAGREAASAFGDGRVFVEKYISQPRHIEIQVLVDRYGQGVHLFERECSIQRRHQKVIEEAPSSILTEEVRTRMGEAALRVANACGYVSAGTVEFLVDADLNFYFMEMNTRLQVEHPVTELITGLDLVAEQLRIAEGEPLGYTQADIGRRGHAIESRIYAEDVANQFLPSPGTLTVHRPPHGPGVRVDAGVDGAGEIPIHYDPMISKLIVYAPTRAEAIERMKRALSEYYVSGVATTIPFCRFVMEHEAFRSGAFSTHFVAEHFRPEDLQGLEARGGGAVTPAQAAALAAALYARKGGQDGQRAEQSGDALETLWRRRSRS